MFGSEKSFNKKENASENVNEKPKSDSRRNFLKTLGALIVGTAIAETPLKALAIESKEKPSIISRSSWDTEWDKTKKQYDLTLGEKFHTKYGEKTANILPYFNQDFASGKDKTLGSKPFEDLKKVYRRCAIHHTDIDTSNVGNYDQARAVRDIELGKMGFNDTGYHFLIASDGTILEGRPINRVGSNAGQTKEANDASSAMGGVSSIANTKKTDKYYPNLQKYIQAMKMDPDYGTLGIALCGDFDAGSNPPSKKQQESLVKLLNWIKGEYDIPTDNIIYHKEIKSKVIEASGLTFVGTNGATDTVCPGKKFPDFSVFKNKLNSDTENALSKTILLDKTI